MNTLNDNLIKTESFYDGLGRTIETRQYESDGNYIATKSIPFIMVQDPETSIWRAATKVSNPYRPNAGEQPVWTTSLSYALGSKVITPDGAIAKTESSGNTVTVTDQTGKKRRSVTNALGQLIRVDEPNDAGQLDVNGNPAQSTIYAYDTLNNLTTVTQGVQTRTFTYNSLSRLLSATNPESGTISYQYDNNGNLTQKTDARQVVTNYVYDNLNRVTQRNYSAPQNLTNYQASPNVSYFYDDVNVAFSKGKLTKVSSAVSETKYTQFDNVGRVLASQQITDGQTYTSGYVYNLSGALIEQTYPSGRVVKNTLDADGDLQQVQSRKTNDTFKNYANSFNYTAAGAVSSMRLGNGRWENTSFNSRLQPTQIGLGTSATNQSLLKLDYDYGTTDNNGNVKSQTITVERSNQSPLVLTQSYVYDSLNRLKSAEEKDASNVTTWKQTYSFDRYGNRRFDQTNTSFPTSFANPNATNPQIDTANNRFTTGQGYTYDLAGNLLTEAEGKTFTYDGENKQKDARNSQNQIIGEYFYDGDGKRVKKKGIVSGQVEETILVYDALGKLVAEYSTVVSTTPKIQYQTNDHLETPRINTNELGAVVSRSDYMPYGEEIVVLGNRTSTEKYVSDDVRQGFTGYIKDDETGLDFAEARMYKKELGRFTSTDPIIMSFKRAIDPQRINLYVYVKNNPLVYLDPFGEDIEEPTGLTEEQQKAYEKWRDEFRATAEGKKTWDKYANDKNFTLKITVLDRGSDDLNKSAQVKDFQFDENKKLTGATMVLGQNLGKGLPESTTSYPILSQLGTTDTAKIGASKIAHEFGHLDDFQSMGKTFYDQQQIISGINSRQKELTAQKASPTERNNDTVLKQLSQQFEKQFGITLEQNSINRDRRADKNAIPTIKQIFRREKLTGEKGL